MIPARILVVEDEFIVAKEIEMRVAAMGYQVVESTPSAEEALKLAHEHRPDLVLMDIRLQGEMDGITAAKEIRRRFHLPVIFLTAYSEDATLERAKLAEPCGYILKPFEERELKSAIEIALNKHQAEREILRLNRLYDVLSQVNQAIVRADSRDELLETICRIMVERGAIHLAWIGWLDPETAKIHPVAHWGRHQELLRVAVFYADDRPEGQGNPGRAIREDRPAFCNECVRDSCLYPVESAPVQFGFKSCGSFPIHFQGRVCGTLNLEIHEAGFFQEREIELLEEVARDISFALDKLDGDAKRIQTEEALRRSEERYRLLVDTSNEGIWAMDGDHVTTYVNQAMADMLGYEPFEIIGTKVEEYLFPEDLLFHQERMKQRHAGQDEVYERRFRRRDGSPLLALASAKALKDDHGRFLGSFAMFTDITERKRVEEALRRSEERHRSIIQAAMDGYTLVDLEGRVLEVNEKYCEMSGYSSEELLSMRTCQLDADRNADEIFVHSREMMARGEARFEARHRRKNGTVYDVEISIQYRPTDGGQLVAFLRDITERQRAAEEKEKMESQLRHAQKLEAIGKLAGGIAHDFNNILSPIIGYTEMAMDDIEESSPSKYDLHQVLMAARRAKELVRQILSFSRLGEEQFMRPIDASLIVKEALKLLRASLPSTVEIRQDIQEVTVLANATQLHQIVVNLCTNAAHAMEDSGTLGVSLQEVALCAQDLVELAITDLKPGKYLRLSVKDTGAGMSPDTMQRIFDPYFTTKEVGKGTGLGLAVVHGIVKHHGGEILVKSKVGRGTVVHVFIPVVESESRGETHVSQVLPKGSERILLVDDESTIAKMGARMLESLGYKVTPMTSPMEALHLFRSQPDQFDLIITDYTMPQMVGTQLANECRQIRAGIPVIICTGHSERLNKEGPDQTGAQAVAMKPLDRKQLAVLIREVLDKRWS